MEGCDFCNKIKNIYPTLWLCFTDPWSSPEVPTLRTTALSYLIKIMKYICFGTDIALRSCVVADACMRCLHFKQQRLQQDGNKVKIWMKEERERMCTHRHGLTAVQRADCRLSFSMCGELNKGAACKQRENERFY